MHESLIQPHGNRQSALNIRPLFRLRGPVDWEVKQARLCGERPRRRRVVGEPQAGAAQTKDLVHRFRAANLHVETTRQQLYAFRRFELAVHANEHLVGRFEPRRFERHLHTQSGADKGAFLVRRFLHFGTERVEILLQGVETPAEVIVVVPRNVGSFACLTEYRQLPDQPGQFQVAGERVDAVRVNLHAEQRVRFIQGSKLFENGDVALISTVKRDPPRSHLLGKKFDLAPDAIVNLLEDALFQAKPRIARQHRRYVIAVQFRKRFGSLAFSDSGNWNHFVSGWVVRRGQQSQVR